VDCSSSHSICFDLASSVQAHDTICTISPLTLTSGVTFSLLASCEHHIKFSSSLVSSLLRPLSTSNNPNSFPFAILIKNNQIFILPLLLPPPCTLLISPLLPPLPKYRVSMNIRHALYTHCMCGKILIPFAPNSLTFPFHQNIKHLNHILPLQPSA